MAFPLSAQLPFLPRLPDLGFLSPLQQLITEVRDHRRPDFGCHLPRLPHHDPVRCYCPEPPPPCPPPDPLKTGCDGKIHTPGGYTIESCGNSEWKITGPDGKCTRVWGDPHVAESDGGKWDF